MPSTKKLAKNGLIRIIPAISSQYDCEGFTVAYYYGNNEGLGLVIISRVQNSSPFGVCSTRAPASLALLLATTGQDRRGIRQIPIDSCRVLHSNTESGTRMAKEVSPVLKMQGMLCLLMVVCYMWVDFLPKISQTWVGWSLLQVPKMDLLPKISQTWVGWSLWALLDNSTFICYVECMVLFLTTGLLGLNWIMLFGADGKSCHSALTHHEGKALHVCEIRDTAQVIRARRRSSNYSSLRVLRHRA